MIMLNAQASKEYYNRRIFKTGQVIIRHVCTALKADPNPARDLHLCWGRRTSRWRPDTEGASTFASCPQNCPCRQRIGFIHQTPFITLITNRRGGRLEGIAVLSIYINFIKHHCVKMDSLYKCECMYCICNIVNTLYINIIYILHNIYYI